jgi:hypothetical protein
MPLYVAEFSALAMGGGAQVPQMPPLAEYTVASGARGAAFNAATRYVRVQPDGTSAMQVEFGLAGSAAVVAGSMRVAANATEYFGVGSNSGLCVAATNVA